MQQNAAVPTNTDRWSFSFESLYAFDNVKNPWFVIFLHAIQKNRRPYTLATQILSARYRLTNTGGPLLLRGNLEFSIGPTVTAIVSGPESYFAGAVGGFRYNFVQPRARLIPYFELRGGVGASDAQKLAHSLQADTTFTYLLGAGLRYEIDPHWSVTLGAVDQHLSNAFFASHDYGIDSLGVNAGIELRY